MGNNAGKITAPVNTDDVSTVLGHASHDVATLCSSERINPAAKYKPIRFDKPSSLSDDDRLGAPADNLGGIYYGIKMAPNTQLYYLHDYNYEYLRVRPGTDWSRLDDFVGYDHNAVFNPIGSVEPKAIKESGCLVRIDYDTTPSGTGVDVAELMTKISANAAFRLANMFPCALVTLGSKRYVRALWDAEKTYPTGTPAKSEFSAMKPGTSGWKNKWLILTNDIPDIKAGDALTVTIFFMETLQVTGGKDFSKWQEVTSSLANGLRVLSCPGAVAKSVEIMTAHPKAAKVTLVVIMSNSVRATWQWLTGEDAPNAGSTYRITLYLKRKDGAGSDLTFSSTVTAGSLAGPLVFSPSGLVSGSAAIEFIIDWVITEVNFNLAVNQGSTTAILPKA